jgi:hypothetical protein
MEHIRFEHRAHTMCGYFAYHSFSMYDCCIRAIFYL